jgi:hypothetical protein
MKSKEILAGTPGVLTIASIDAIELSGFAKPLLSRLLSKRKRYLQSNRSSTKTDNLGWAGQRC